MVIENPLGQASVDDRPGFLPLTLPRQDFGGFAGDDLSQGAALTRDGDDRLRYRAGRRLLLEVVFKGPEIGPQIVKIIFHGNSILPEDSFRSAELLNHNPASAAATSPALAKTGLYLIEGPD